MCVASCNAAVAVDAASRSVAVAVDVPSWGARAAAVGATLVGAAAELPGGGPDSRVWEYTAYPTKGRREEET